MKIRRTGRDGFWPTADEQRGWWHGVYLGIGRFHFRFHWHVSNQERKPSDG